MSKSCFFELTIVAVIIIGFFHSIQTRNTRNCAAMETCVNLTKCPLAVTLLEQRFDERLKKMLCEYNTKMPKVCCPTDAPIVFNNNTDIGTKESETIISVKKPLSYITSTTQEDSIKTTAPTNTNVNESITFEKEKVCCPTEVPLVSNSNTDTATRRSEVITTARPPMRHITSTTNLLTQEASIQRTFAQTITNVNENSTFKNEKEFKARSLLPSEDICGFSEHISDRIIGGQIAAIDEFPWMAQIRGSRYRPNAPDIFYCAGSLITERYVLTAAHCIDTFKPKRIRLGEWDTESDLDCYDERCSDTPVDVEVATAVIHPNYNKTTLLDDIGLIELKHAVNFTEFIRPICLPTTKAVAEQDYVTGTPYWTAGWGMTEFELPSVIKRKVSLDTAPIEQCINAYKNEMFLTKTSNVICAGGKIGKDTCRGDSGGPLMKLVKNESEPRWFLFGITSFGSVKCGKTEKPSGYTRVVKYIDWIIENIKK